MIADSSSIPGSMMLPSSSFAFKILHVVKMETAANQTIELPRCLPGQILQRLCVTINLGYPHRVRFTCDQNQTKFHILGKFSIECTIFVQKSLRINTDGSWYISGSWSIALIDNTYEHFTGQKITEAQAYQAFGITTAPFGI